MHPRVRPEVTVQQVGEESLVLDLASDQIHQLNATAAWILAQCDGEASIASISNGFAAHFSVDAETAARDVGATLEQLQRIGVVELG